MNLLQRESFRTLCMALMLIGVLLIGFGIVRYATLSYQIGQNVAYQIQSSQAEIDPQTMNEAQGLMAADIALRETVRARNEAVIFAGVGIVALAVGWIGRDLAAAQRRRSAQQTAS